jgi:hypothetical protein
MMPAIPGQSTSYIVGTLRKYEDKVWTTLEPRAMIQFYLDQVFPLIELVDQKGEVLFLSLRNIKDTASCKEAYAVVVEHQGMLLGVELHQVYSGNTRISDERAVRIFDEIVTRCESQLRDAREGF